MRNQLKDKHIPILNEEPDALSYRALRGEFSPTAVSDGSKKLLDHLKDVRGLYPDACLALIGYSTGALAIEKMLASIPADVGNRIAAVEMFADPTNWASVAGGSPGVGPYGDRTTYECNAQDPACGPRTRFLPRTAEEWKECGEELKKGLVNALGPCAAPQHLPPAYEKSGAAENAAKRAAGAIVGPTAVPRDWNLA
ncbi:cutinase family protein [Streptomyces virginiae]|uniref:cutinase family protein n=1 Tax=Streptomyces virginiae TaxID=1961 RepID=UPI0038647D70|nr:cutinase family protein [Streptomyces virginiae]